LRAGGSGVRAIARPLQRAPSTISRELHRNAATRSGNLDYRSLTAQWHADLRARRPKVARLAVNAALRQYVRDRLAGSVTKLDGTRLAGPDVRWIGRRHGRRQDRRWAGSWSLEQVELATAEWVDWSRYAGDPGTVGPWWKSSMFGYRAP
jgi:hypothetical protein